MLFAPTEPFASPSASRKLQVVQVIQRIHIGFVIQRRHHQRIGQSDRLSLIRADVDTATIIA